MTERNHGVGIDLGTSLSAIARCDISTGRYNFAEARDTGGNREIPSVAYVDTDGTLLFGKVAENMQNSLTEMDRVIPNFKLLLRQNSPITFADGGPSIEPATLIRGLLAHLKRCYETTFKTVCDRAMVTVPAWEDFDVDYRGRVRDAAMGSDPLFESVATVTEPDAVLLAMGPNLSHFVGMNVMVFDMGGGTLDVSIREVDVQDGHPLLRQLAIVGSDAAGRRVTEALSSHLLDLWERKARFTFSDDDRKRALRINHIGLDEAKRHLSSLVAQKGLRTDRTWQCQVRYPGRGQGSFTHEVPASLLVDLARPICDEARDTVEKALAHPGIDPTDIDAYFMVGGSSQLPLMKDMLTELFGGRPPEPLQGPFGMVDSTLAVCHGAAIHDLEQDDVHVPATKTVVLERKLPYAISLLVDARRATEVLVPADAVLPFGPVNKTFSVHAEGDTEVSIELVRGSGDPAQCVALAPQIVGFPKPQRRGAALELSCIVDQSGELVLSAFGPNNVELGVIRANSLPDGG